MSKVIRRIQYNKDNNDKNMLEYLYTFIFFCKDARWSFKFEPTISIYLEEKLWQSATQQQRLFDDLHCEDIL